MTSGAEMTPRERVLSALARRETDRVPIALGFGVNAPVLQNLVTYLGVQDVGQVQKILYNYSDVRIVSPRYIGPELHSYGDSREDYWGVRRKAVSYGTGSYNEIDFYPLAEVRDVSDLDKHRWPSLDWFDFNEMPSRIDALQRSGPYAIRSGSGNIFETSWYMRGFEQIFVDLALQPEIANEIMRRVTDFFIAYNTRLLEVADGRIDIIFTADDIAGQHGLLMSANMWEEYLKPHHKRMNKAIHEFDVKIMYHSDGAVMDAVPGLLDMGIDILEALQFNADRMDPAVLKQKYGDRLCFHGGICVQKTLPHGTPADVRQEVIDRIQVLGKNGGYILAPSHAIQAGTPPENVITLFETAMNYRRK